MRHGAGPKLDLDHLSTAMNKDRSTDFDGGMAVFSNPLDDEVFEAEPIPNDSSSADAVDEAVQETAGDEDEDDEDEISLVKTMTLALTLRGVGDWIVQLYTISGFFLGLSLLTLMDISWPDAWDVMFGWLNIIVVPVKHVPFDALLDDVELGNFMNFLCVVFIHPVILAYAAYRRQFFNSVDAKTKWEEDAKKGFKLQTILLLLFWVLPPIIVRTHHMLLNDAGEHDASRADWQVWMYGERDGSGSETESAIPHAANSFFVMWLWGMGLLILPFLAYRHVTRFNYKLTLLRKEPVPTFFGAWAKAEGSVILYLYIFLHLSSIVASIEVALTCGPESDCFAHHRGLGQVSFVMAAIFGPLYALGLPITLMLASNSFVQRLEGYDASGYLDPEPFTAAGRAKFASNKDRRKMEAERMKQFSVVVQGDVAKGQLDAFRSPPMLQAVKPFHPHQWWMRSAMMFDKVVLAFFIVGFENESGGDVDNFAKDVQLIGAACAAILSLLLSMLIRPMIDSNEGLTEVLSRASIVAIIVFGAVNFYFPSLLWDLVLIAITVGTIISLGLMFGPLKIQGILKLAWGRFMADKKAAELSETWVKNLTSGKVMSFNDVDFEGLNTEQKGWLMIHHGESLLQRKAELKTILIGGKSLPTHNPYGEAELSFEGNDVDTDYPWVFSTLLGWWLKSTGGGSMTSVNILTQPAPTEVTPHSSTDSAELLIDAFQNHSSLLTLLGIPASQAVLDLTDKQLDCGLTKILAAELASGSLPRPRNGGGVQTLRMCNNPSMLIEASTGEPDISGFQSLCSNVKSLVEWDLSGCSITEKAILTMARVVEWSELSKLTIDSTGHRKDEEQSSYTLTATDEQIDLASQKLGPADAKLLTVWLAKENVAAVEIDVTDTRLDIGGGEHLVQYLEKQDKVETIIVGRKLPLKEELKTDELNFAAGGVDDNGTLYIITWWLQTPFAANIEEVDLSNNQLELEGVRALVGMNKPEKLKRVKITVGPNKSKLTLFDETVTKVSLRDDHMDQYATCLVVACVPALPKVTSIDIFKNSIGDGLAQLTTMLNDNPNIRSICGFENEVPVADWSNQKLTPNDCDIIKAELDIQGGFLSEASSMDLSDNPKMADGANTILEALERRPMTSLNLSGCQLPGTVNSQIAKMVSESTGTAFSKSIVLLTLDSSGSEPRAFTLNANETVLDVGNCGLGPDDADLIAAWLEKQAVIDRLHTVKINSNPEIGAGNHRGVLHLVEAMQDIPIKELNATGCGLENAAEEFGQLLFSGTSRFSETISSIQIDCKGGEGSYRLDASSKVIDLKNKNLGAADLKLIAGWLTKDQVKTNAKALLMSQNPGIIGEYGETDMSGLRELSANINSLVQWDLSECNTDVEATLLLAKEINWSKCTLSELILDSTGDMSGRTERYPSEATRRQAQKTYRLEAHDKIVDLSGKNIGSADLELLTSWLSHTASGFRQPIFAMAKKIKLANNPLVGKGGTELEGLEAFCGALSSTSSCDLSGCQSMNAQATIAVVENINWEQCKMQELTLDSSGVPNNGKPYQLDKQNTANFNNKNLGYADAMLMTKWLSQGDVAGRLSEVVLAGNPSLVGDVDQSGSLLKPDVYLIHFEDLCAALNAALDATTVLALDVSGCGIGPKAVVQVAELINASNRLFKSLKLSSTGDVAKPMTYELGFKATGIELKAKSLGVADIEVLGAFTTRLEMRKNVSRIDLSQNPQISAKAGDDKADKTVMALLTNFLDMHILKLNLSESNLSPLHLSALAPCTTTGGGRRYSETKLKKRIKELTLSSTGDLDNEEHIKTYTLKADPNESKIDLCNLFLGSDDLVLLGMWLSKPEVASVVATIDVSRCPIVDCRPAPTAAVPELIEGDPLADIDHDLRGNAWVTSTIDKSLDGLEALCSSLSAYKYGTKRKKVSKTLNLAGTGIGNKGCLIITKLINDCGALLGIDISQNEFDIAGAKSIGGAIKSAAQKHQSLHWVKVGNAAEGVTIPLSKKKIKKLDFSQAALSVPVGPVEAAVLGGALLTMPSVRELNFSGQPLVGEIEDVGGLEDILSSLKANGSVNSLILSNCGLQNRSEQALAHFLQNNGSLKTLNLLGNPFTKGVKNVVATFNLQENISTLCGFKDGTKIVNWAGAGRGPSDMDLLAAEMEKGTGRRSLEHLQQLDLTGEQNLGKDPEKHIKKVRKAASTYREYIWQRQVYYKGVEIVPVDPKNRIDPERPGAPEFSDSDEEGGGSADEAEAEAESGSEYYESSDENDGGESESEVRSIKPSVHPPEGRRLNPRSFALLAHQDSSSAYMFDC